jgi:hypothetical protein
MWLSIADWPQLIVVGGSGSAARPLSRRCRASSWSARKQKRLPIRSSVSRETLRSKFARCDHQAPFGLLAFAVSRNVTARS